MLWWMALVTADIGLSVPTVLILMGIAVIVQDRWKRERSTRAGIIGRQDLHRMTEQYSQILWLVLLSLIKLVSPN
jgi:hypothetical protein